MRMRAFVGAFVSCHVDARPICVVLPLPTMKHTIYQVFVILAFHKSSSFASLKHMNITKP